MSDDIPEKSKPRIPPVLSNAVPDLSDNWLELEFYTQEQKLKGQISCPAGMRILDMLNTPCSSTKNEKTEFMELKDYLKTDDDSSGPKTVCVKTDDILFVSAPDINMGRGLGAKGEFQVFPFVPKEKIRVSIQLIDYSLIGNLFRRQNQTMVEVLNDGMFFLPLTEVMISQNHRYSGDRPFVAANKKQIRECREEYRNHAGEILRESKPPSYMVPICSWCKKIRDDKGNWQAVEQYFKEHSSVEFTHGICPDCKNKYYPD